MDRSRRLSLARLLALLALVGQLAAGASVPRALAWQSVAAAPICHTGDDSRDTPAQRHSLDCLLCPFCAAMVSPALPLPASGPMLAAPSVVQIDRAALPPPAIGPPSLLRHAGQPRAPPIPV
jgi:hypothetical protein